MSESDLEQKVNELVLAELHRIELAKKARIIASDDFKDLKEDFIHYTDNADFGFTFDWRNEALSTTIDERLYELLIRGYHKDHPRWHTERFALAQLANSPK